MDLLNAILEKVTNALKGLKKISDDVEKIKASSVPSRDIDYSFFEMYSSNTFLKIKANLFKNEKVMFSFVDKSNPNSVKSIDCFLTFGEALLLAEKAKSSLIKKCVAEKSKGEQYPKESYTSPFGGINEEKCKQRNLRTDGKAISRLFKIGAGSRSEVIVTAELKAGHSDSNGLIVPEKGKPELVIRVPMQYKDLVIMSKLLEANITAYLSAQYSSNAYKSEYNKSNSYNANNVQPYAAYEQPAPQEYNNYYQSA